MIEALALTLLGAPASAVPAVQDEALGKEIVVIGNKLGTWRGPWRTKKGVVGCKTRKSSGDREVDAIGCESLIACVTPQVPTIQAIADSDFPKAEKNRRMTEAAQAVGPCLASAREAGIRALAQRRTGQ